VPVTYLVKRVLEKIEDRFPMTTRYALHDRSEDDIQFRDPDQQFVTFVVHVLVVRITISRTLTSEPCGDMSKYKDRSLLRDELRSSIGSGCGRDQKSQGGNSLFSHALGGNASQGIG
jgi:hypothetical protein